MENIVRMGFLIIRGDNWHPSLAIFQFLLWTFIIAFDFFGKYLTRISGVVEPQPSIPYNVLALMGISGVPIISEVSSIKYNTSTVKHCITYTKTDKL